MYVPQKLRHRDSEALILRARKELRKQNIRFLLLGVVVLLASLPAMNAYDLWMEKRLERVAAEYYETGKAPWGFDTYGGEISFHYLPIGPRKVVRSNGEIHFED